MTPRNSSPILAVIVLLFLFRCNQALITYNRFKPPEINVKAVTDPALVIYRFDTNRWDFNQKKKIAVYHEAFHAFNQALKESLDKLQHFEVDYDTTLRAILWKNPADKIRQDSIWVSRFAREKSYNYYILVNHFNMWRSDYVETEDDDDGSKSKTAYYFLNAEAKIDIWHRSGRLIDESHLQDRIQIDDRSVLSGLLAIGPSIGNHGKQANEVAKALGSKYYQMFFSQPETVYGYYYIDKELSGLQSLMEAQKWQEARTMLLDMYPMVSGKMAEHVAHNLAVIYEILGDDNEAGIWRLRSDE